MRLIRLRRKKEQLQFWNELKLIPKWLVGTVVVLYIAAVVIAILVNLSHRYNPYGNDMFPPELRDYPALASLALAGLVTLMAVMLTWIIFMVAYVNRDAARRGMNSALWTLFVLILMPSSGGIIGFVIYLLMRRASTLSVPTLRKTRRAALQFLPQLQMQPASVLPELQKGNCGDRQILPLLRERVEASGVGRNFF